MAGSAIMTQKRFVHSKVFKNFVDDFQGWNTPPAPRPAGCVPVSSISVPAAPPFVGSVAGLPFVG
jgi:hypothetical protein